MKQERRSEDLTEAARGTVGPFGKLDIRPAAWLQAKRDFTNGLTIQAWNHSAIDGGEEDLGRIEQRRFLADHYAAAHEILFACQVLKVVQ